MDEKLIEYAPIVIVILMFIWQNNVFVRPEQLEKKHREILDDVDEKFKNKYVELNAYKEFQSHVLKGIEDANTGINELKEFLIGKGRG
jgi:hypothetical protein